MKAANSDGKGPQNMVINGGWTRQLLVVGCVMKQWVEGIRICCSEPRTAKQWSAVGDVGQWLAGDNMCGLQVMPHQQSDVAGRRSSWAAFSTGLGKLLSKDWFACSPSW
ncbi:hypothetical protein SLA2020_273910 [Shorea laevis]